MENLSPALLAWIRRSRSGLLILALAVSCIRCFGQLPVDLDLPSETVDSGSLVLQASNSITSSASFVVQDPANVTLTAGSSIRLEPGFDAVATDGTETFHAVINPNVVQWQPIPVPAPPTACQDCGLNFTEAASGIIPQDTYAPSSTNILYAVCFDEDGDVVPCNLSLSAATYPNTNGHYHNLPPAPTSGISPTSGNTADYPDWQMPVTLRTTQVGQFENISVVPISSGEGNPAITGYYDYAVGYSGLVYLANSNIFMQTGGNTTGHGDNTFNHSMTVNAATGLQAAATFYINQYNPGQKICINDMALPMGGKFDLKDNWQSPHISHDQGTAADVAAVPGSCPAKYAVNLNLFRQACITTGHSTAQNTITEGNHVHCRWPN
jgi:hypothetical protein